MSEVQEIKDEPKMVITVQKAKLKKGLYLQADYTIRMPDGSVQHHPAVLCSDDAHEDLRAGFRVLGAHLASMTDSYGNDKHISMDVLCRGFSIKGNEGDDNYGVTLTGQRTLKSGFVLILNSPFLRFSQTEVYGPMDSLLHALEECKKEVMLALFENKKAPDVQGKLDLYTEEDD